MKRQQHWKAYIARFKPKSLFPMTTDITGYPIRLAE
jgi:hypothetical protein